MNHSKILETTNKILSTLYKTLLLYLILNVILILDFSERNVG